MRLAISMPPKTLRLAEIEYPVCDLVHRHAMIFGGEQVAVPIHCDLQAGVASKRLNGFRREPSLDPA